jgi:coatomer subunit epsilon
MVHQRGTVKKHAKISQFGDPLRTASNHVFSTHRNNHNSIIIATMDPFSAEGELINIHNLFHQGQYAEVIDFDTSALSPENALPARILSLRAKIALGQAEEVIAEVKGQDEPESVAVGALAELTVGNEAKALEIAEALASENGGNGTVQVLAGTILQAAGKSEEALTLLGQHQGSRMFTTLLQHY